MILSNYPAWQKDSQKLGVWSPYISPGPYAAGHFDVDRSNFQPAPETWYLLEISSYNDMIQVWVDGQMMLEYQDPQPLAPGTIGLEAHIWNDPETIFYFDDISVCELSVPFVPMPTPEPVQ